MSTAVSDIHHHQEVLSGLRKRWAAFTLAGIFALGSGALLLQTLWETGFALRWLAISSTGMLYLAIILWRNLEQNHRPGEGGLLATFGPGNNLTLLRGALLAALAGFLLSPTPVQYLAWAPAIIYTLAIAADFLDGYAARVSNHVTRLGEALDMSLDGLGILIATLLAIQFGTLPLWYLAVALSRPLFLLGIRLREKRGLMIHELNPSVRRRAFAGLQMGFLSAMLWPVFTPPGTTVAALIFALPFLGGFVVDWLIISGDLKQEKRRHPVQNNPLFNTWLPLALRLAALVTLLMHTADQASDTTNPFGSLLGSGNPTTAAIGSIIFGLQIMVMLLLVFGVAGRVAAIAGLLLLGIQQIYTGLNLAQYFLIFVYVTILYLGTGKHSLWKPEDRLIFKKVGGPGGQVVPDHPRTQARR